MHSLWKKRFRAGSWRGRPGLVPTFLRVVLGPYVQYCPCEASEQKLGQKPKSELKEIELSYCQWPSYGQIMSMSPKWHLAYFLPIDGNFGQIGRYGTSNLFCQLVTLPLIYKPNLKSIKSKLAILSPKILQKSL